MKEYFKKNMHKTSKNIVCHYIHTKHSNKIIMPKQRYYIIYFLKSEVSQGSKSAPDQSRFVLAYILNFKFN